VTQEPEWLDRPGIDPAEAERALLDLERVYHRLLGSHGLRRPVLAAAGALPHGRCLDVGAGGGHVATDLRAAAGPARRLVVVGLDAKLSHLLAARRLGSPQLAVVGDAGALPFAAGAFACAFSHLLFHHFDAATNRRIVEEMRRVARRAVVVDLRRSLVARLLSRLCLRLLRLGPTAYHDGVVSMARSYDLGSVAEVVAGLPVLELRRRFLYRWSLVVAGTADEP
jgi:SAM-dependent methyltransferase